MKTLLHYFMRWMYSDTLRGGAVRRLLAANEREKEFIKVLELIPPHKLRMLADWLDVQDTRVEGMTNIKRGREAQHDLRKMADMSENILSKTLKK